MQPLHDVLKPYQTYAGSRERGTPITHSDYGKLISGGYTLYLDCEKHPSDPQCKDETFKDSPMINAGHHIRSKNDSPIIGILTQPIPSEENGDSPLWE